MRFTTAQNVVPISRQIQWFRQYKVQLEGTIGKSEARRILDSALYVVSSGSNDFVNNFYINLNLRRRYNVSQYMDLISGRIVSTLQVKSHESLSDVISCKPVSGRIICGWVEACFGSDHLWIGRGLVRLI